MDLLNYCIGKSKERRLVKDYRYMMYFLQLWEILMNQFEYEGLPDSVPAEWIEGYLITNGTCAFGEKDGKVFVATGGYSGQINGYVPEDYIAAIPGKGNIEGSAEGVAEYDEKISDKVVVVGWNNTAHSPELELADFAAALCEGRTSEDINVFFSRFLRIPIARDEKEKTVIENAIKAIIEGRFEAVTSPTQFDDIIRGSENTRQFLDLVDVKEVDKLQYLNQYMDNLLKRFMRRHGFSLNITNKLAQQTNAEMHGEDDYSMIYPMIQLKYREKMIEDLNNSYLAEKYNFKASVKFSKLLQNSYDKVMNYVPDELNEKGIIEGAEDVENSVEDVENVKEGEEDVENSDN